MIIDNLIDIHNKMSIREGLKTQLGISEDLTLMIIQKACTIFTEDTKLTWNTNKVNTVMIKSYQTSDEYLVS